MRTVHAAARVESYKLDNEGLIPDVLAAELLLREIDSAVGNPLQNYRGEIIRHADGRILYWVLQTIAHTIVYRWLSDDEIRIDNVYPTGPTIDEFLASMFED